MNDAVDNVTPPDMNVDLYCLNCGYNLRGQSGDPRRCPECFYMNPVGELEIPAAVITSQIRRMESVPAGCVGIILMVVPLLLGLGLASSKAYLFIAVALLIATVLSALWVYFVVRFRYYCLKKPGWLGALVKYHLCGLTLCAAILVVPCVGAVMTAVQHPWLENPEALPITLCAVAGLGLFVIIGGSSAHSRLKGILEPLQREIAVTLARDGLRQALRTGRRARHFRPQITES
ncbi:MAG: hypothetical protein IH988_09405 [Planctomycetes bacterium]|nr:hypothetical protein [Planctomycetota bacterium]